MMFIASLINNKIFAGDQPHRFWTNVQRFKDLLCLHHHGML